VKLHPATKLPPKGATCLLIYRIEEGNTGAGLEETHSIGYHDGARWFDVHNGAPVAPWLKGWALLELTEAPTDAPPDRACVRWFFTVDVPPQTVRALNAGLWMGVGLNVEARLSEANPRLVEVFDDDDNAEALVKVSEWLVIRGWS